jgi:hypothetical protein
MAVGTKYLPLPVPRFSTGNPYWPDPREIWRGFKPLFHPRNSARDFLYANVWEMNKLDPHGAYCVRTATQLTIRIYLRLTVRENVRRLLIQQKEKKNEEAA